MKSFSTIPGLALLLAGSGLAARTLPRIDTPVLAQCEEAVLTWSGGEPPFFLSVEPAADPSGPAIEFLGSNLEGHSFVWTVNIAEGTAIEVLITDSTGAIGRTLPVVVQPSADTSCLSA